VTPDQVIEALLAAGFIDGGGRAGFYRRLRWPETRDGRPGSVIVPLDDSFADYDELMRGLLGELELVARIGRVAQAALDALPGEKSTYQEP
jgi:hypothetical protein